MEGQRYPGDAADWAERRCACDQTLPACASLTTSESARRELICVTWARFPLMKQRDFPRDEHESLMRQLVGSMTDSMRHLHSLGVRSFLVMTSPPIELNPEAHLPGHGGYHDRHMTAADGIYINKLIRAAALELERELSDANVMLFDFEAFHRLYTSFPEAFGLTDTERYNMAIHGVKPDMGQMGFV